MQKFARYYLVIEVNGSLLGSRDIYLYYLLNPSISNVPLVAYLIGSHTVTLTEPSIDSLPICKTSSPIAPQNNHSLASSPQSPVSASVCAFPPSVPAPQ